MRHAAAMLAALLLLCALPKRAYAEELVDRAAEEAGAYSLEEQLTDEEKEISGRLSFDGSYDAGGAIARVWKSFLNNIVSELRDNLSFGARLITIALLCALGGSLCSSKGISEYIEIAGCCGAAIREFGNTPFATVTARYAYTSGTTSFCAMLISTSSARLTAANFAPADVSAPPAAAAVNMTGSAAFE